MAVIAQVEPAILALRHFRFFGCGQVYPSARGLSTQSSLYLICNRGTEGRNVFMFTKTPRVDRNSLAPFFGSMRVVTIAAVSSGFEHMPSADSSHSETQTFRAQLKGSNDNNPIPSSEDEHEGIRFFRGALFGLSASVLFYFVAFLAVTGAFSSGAQ